MDRLAPHGAPARRYYEGIAKLFERLAALSGLADEDIEFSAELLAIARQIRSDIARIH